MKYKFAEVSCVDEAGVESKQFGVAMDATHFLLEDATIVDLVNKTVSSYKGKHLWEAKKITITPAEIPETLQSFFENGLQTISRIREIEDTIQKLKVESAFLENGFLETKSQVQKEKGILSSAQFIEAFKRNLSSNVRCDMANYYPKQCTSKRYSGYKAQYDVYVDKYSGGKDLHVYLGIDIKLNQKGIPSVPAYMTALGELKLDTHSSEYQTLLNTYSSTLPVKTTPREYLELIDRHIARYVCDYKIDIAQPLTEKYAKQLADVFCAGKTKRKEEKETER